MTCRHEPLIDDYVDGALTPSERSTFDAHLGGCASCAALVEDLQAIRRAATSLEQRPVPPHVWTRIEAHLNEPRQSTAWWRRVPLMGAFPGAGWMPLLAAAAAVLVVATGLWTLRAPGSSTSAPAPVERVATAAPADESVDQDLRVAQQHYETAIAGLQEIAADRTSLDAQTSAVLDSSLSVIDQAIDESRAALNDQPANDAARESLFEALRSKVVLLQDTVTLINEMRKGDQDGVARAISGLNQ